MKKKIVILAGCLVSIGCLYWVFSGVDFNDMLAALKSFNPLWLIPSLFLFYWSMYLRAIRWGHLFRPAYNLTGRTLFKPLMIGFMFNSIFPARVGEFVRAYQVSKQEQVGLPTTLATILTERIFDGVTILICLITSLAMLPPIDPDLEIKLWNFTVRGAMLDENMPKLIWGCVVLIGGVVLCLIPAFTRLMERVILGLPLVPEPIKKKLASIVEGIVLGFESVRQPVNLLAIVLYSIAIWVLVVASNWTLALGFTQLPINFLHATALMSLIAVFILVPAAPGYWGPYEAGVVFSLIFMGVTSDQSIAVAYAIVMHLVQFVPIVAMGLIFASRAHVIRPGGADSSPQ